MAGLYAGERGQLPPMPFASVPVVREEEEEEVEEVKEDPMSDALMRALERRMNADSAGADPAAAATAAASPVAQHSPHDAAEREDTTSSLPTLAEDDSVQKPAPDPGPGKLTGAAAVAAVAAAVVDKLSGATAAKAAAAEAEVAGLRAEVKAAEDKLYSGFSSGGGDHDVGSPGALPPAAEEEGSADVGEVREVDAATAAQLAAVRRALARSRQGLTLVHFSAQPEPFFSLKSPDVHQRTCSC